VASGFHCGVNEIVAVLGCYTQLVSSLTDISGQLTGSLFKIKPYMWTTYSFDDGTVAMLGLE
jgi:hypothetical protein